MAKTYQIIVSFLSGWGAEHISKDGSISKVASFLFSNKKDAENALSIAKKHFAKKGLKRNFRIHEQG